MNLDRLRSDLDGLEPDPLPQLCAATDRLRRFAGTRPHPNALRERALIDEVLNAAVQAEQTLAIQRARIRHLESLSITDELTGLLNRRGFQFELGRALARAGRSGETGLLMLCDLDRFKAINDRYGHMAGDAVLVAIAGLLRSKTRRSDYVGRLGGDEFAVLMTHSTRAQAERRVGVLAELVNGLLVDWEDRRISVTASFGFEGYHGGSQADTLLFLTDRALYRDKAPRLVVTDSPDARSPDV